MLSVRREVAEMYLPQEDELREEFIRPASGPGGQHLNKTSNGVRLIFDHLACDGLPDFVKARLGATPVIIVAKESRSLQQNRQLARQKLHALLEKAFIVPKTRKKTKATRASQERRLASKARRSSIKNDRRKPQMGD